ncbi:MAG: CCA tRNA nucleotidyltransferase [Promethearchaeota archaeon]
MSIQHVLQDALHKLKPTKSERDDIQLQIEKIIDLLVTGLKKAYSDFEVQVEGSIAKDTWLSNNKEIDIFILLPPETFREHLQDVLTAVKHIISVPWVERYAEHPFLEFSINEYKVEVVPCFKVPNSKQLKSAVDRTPFHTQYIKTHLSPQMRDDVRLLKGFTKGIGVYGAELEIGGFSGYLCELLIVAYSSFLNLLQKAGSWKHSFVIDIENHYKNVLELRKLFDAPLIVVDPVDSSRNVASALTFKNFSIFVAAASEFLRAPHHHFFFPPSTPRFSIKEILARMNSRETHLIFLEFPVPSVVSDILWGQLYKSLSALRILLEQNDFSVFRSDIWTDEQTLVVMILELEHKSIPSVAKRSGPPVTLPQQATKFTNKYIENKEVFSGPWIDENGKWTVEIKRNFTKAEELLTKKLFSPDLEEIGLGKYIAMEIPSAKIYVNAEIESLLNENPAFLKFFIEYLIKIPKWLMTSS